VEIGIASRTPRAARILAIVTALALASCTENVAYDYRRIEVTSYSHDAWAALLRKHLDPAGRVDYAAWKADPADLEALDAYINLIANASPESHPQLFPTPRDVLAYWINTYNALVIRAVLEHWPIQSVTDVSSGLSFVRGQGFFANRKYLVGGQRISLYELENGKLRNQNDPRIHFAINCASRSCPPIDREAFFAEGLDGRLEARAHAFVNSEANVYPSPEGRTVHLSMIFEWYEGDFLASLPKGSTILDYVLAYAEPELAGKLRRAKAEGWKVDYLTYDWKVNWR
jgi:hypothetical protein